VAVGGPMFDVSVSGFDPPNEDQKKATQQALNRRFTMIQGPPGFTISFN
jgi:hypothetical protein